MILKSGPNSDLVGFGLFLSNCTNIRQNKKKPTVNKCMYDEKKSLKNRIWKKKDEIG